MVNEYHKLKKRKKYKDYGEVLSSFLFEEEKEEKDYFLLSLFNSNSIRGKECGFGNAPGKGCSFSSTSNLYCEEAFQRSDYTVENPNDYKLNTGDGCGNEYNSCLACGTGSGYAYSRSYKFSLDSL